MLLAIDYFEMLAPNTKPKALQTIKSNRADS